MDRLLILGAKGTLGTQLTKLYPDALAWDREDVDVRDFPAFQSKVAALPHIPGAIVNCVAFNDVDGAEDRPETAFALNASFPSQLAELTRQLRCPLIHYSTNYVFDGARGEYSESDIPSPLSVYGHSKLKGEQLVLGAGGHSYVVRTAVIFGPKGISDLSKKSFVDIMLDLSATRKSLQIVSDEVNSVTYAPDLAAHTRLLLETLPSPGIYHVTNSGGASWFDFATEIFRLASRNVTAIPVPSTHFPRKARRPSRAILLNSKLPPLRSWQEALAEFLGSATSDKSGGNVTNFG